MTFFIKKFYSDHIHLDLVVYCDVILHVFILEIIVFVLRKGGLLVICSVLICLHCLPGYFGLCGDFMNARNKGMDLVQGIISETNYPLLTGGINKNYMINEDRMGTLPFVYYNFNSGLGVFSEVSLF